MHIIDFPFCRDWHHCCTWRPLTIYMTQFTIRRGFLDFCTRRPPATHKITLSLLRNCPARPPLPFRSFHSKVFLIRPEREAKHQHANPRQTLFNHFTYIESKNRIPCFPSQSLQRLSNALGPPRSADQSSKISRYRWACLWSSLRRP
jgi:hypothetical protein